MLLLEGENLKEDSYELWNQYSFSCHTSVDGFVLFRLRGFRARYGDGLCQVCSRSGGDVVGNDLHCFVCNGGNHYPADYPHLQHGCQIRPARFGLSGCLADLHLRVGIYRRDFHCRPFRCRTRHLRRGFHHRLRGNYRHLLHPFYPYPRQFQCYGTQYSRRHLPPRRATSLSVLRLYWRLPLGYGLSGYLRRAVCTMPTTLPDTSWREFPAFAPLSWHWSPPSYARYATAIRTPSANGGL